jgi:hypothetical protein
MTNFELQNSIRNRETRIKENQKLIEQHKFTITKLLLTIQHEQEQLAKEKNLLAGKKKGSLL